MLDYVHVVKSDGHGPQLPMLAQIVSVDVPQGFPTFKTSSMSKKAVGRTPAHLAIWLIFFC